MTDFLPLFPLKLVVFPDEQLNLHIFEPRYKQLIRECELNGTTFGIPAFIGKKVMDYGTEIKLLGIENRKDSGEMDIRTQGIGVFKIHKFYKAAPKKLYAGADIERIDDETSGDVVLNEQIFELLSQLFALLDIRKTVPDDATIFKTYEVAHHVGFSLEQEYQFLCLELEAERQVFMFKHLKRLIPVVREMERLKERAKMNGHFKNVIPPKI